MRSGYTVYLKNRYPVGTFTYAEWFDSKKVEVKQYRREHKMNDDDEEIEADAGSCPSRCGRRVVPIE